MDILLKIDYTCRMAEKYTKSELKELEKLTKTVSVKGREKQFRDLLDHLKKWDAGKLSGEQVEEEIIAFRPTVEGEFGENTSQKSDPALPVVQGFIDGLIKKDEISKTLFEKISIQIDLVDL